MKPSILMVVRPATGGMKRHVELLTAGLIEHGCRVGIAGPVELEIEPDIPNGAWTRYTVPVGSSNPISITKSARKIASIAQDYDIIHVHGLTAVVVSGLASHISHKPMILTVHNQIPSMNPIQKRVLQKSLKVTNELISVSKAVAEEITKLGLTDKPIHVIPNGIDLSKFADTGLSASALTPPIKLLGVGRLSREKGFDLLIEAMLLLPADYHLTIAGDGPERESLENLARSIDPNGMSIQLIGKVKDVPKWMAVSDMVVIPSRQEGQGIVALEAMAAGRSIVAANVGGLPETLGNGEFGVLVEPNSASALAAGIQQVMSDSIRRAKVIEAGQRYALRECSVERMVEKVLGVYEESM